VVDELFTGLGKQYLMTELDGFAGLAAFEQFGVFFEKAVYLCLGGRPETLNNPFVGLIVSTMGR
jgi:hypothetical protein